MAGYSNPESLLTPYNNAGLVDPGANALRLGLANMYGIQGLQQAAQDASLEHDIQQNKYNNALEDNPVQAEKRKVDIGLSRVQQDELNSGRVGNLAKETNLAGVSKEKLQQQQNTLQQQILGATEIAAAAKDLEGSYGSLEKNPKWDYWKTRVAKAGYDMPKWMDTAGVDVLQRHGAAATQGIETLRAQYAANAEALAKWDNGGKQTAASHLEGVKYTADKAYDRGLAVQDMKNIMGSTVEAMFNRVMNTPGILTEQGKIIVEQHAQNQFNKTEQAKNYMANYYTSPQLQKEYKDVESYLEVKGKTFVDSLVKKVEEAKASGGTVIKQPTEVTTAVPTKSTTKEEYDKLPKGSKYIDPTGKERIKS